MTSSLIHTDYPEAEVHSQQTPYTQSPPPPYFWTSQLKCSLQKAVNYIQGEHGKIIWIKGPTGSGKSRFMDILCEQLPEPPQKTSSLTFDPQSHLPALYWAIDDAENLSRAQQQACEQLLREGRNIILSGNSEQLNDWLSPYKQRHEVLIRPLNLHQTRDWLNRYHSKSFLHRRTPLSKNRIADIHIQSGGLIGQVTLHADQLLDTLPSHQRYTTVFTLLLALGAGVGIQTTLKQAETTSAPEPSITIAQTPPASSVPTELQTPQPVAIVPPQLQASISYRLVSDTLTEQLPAVQDLAWLAEQNPSHYMLQLAGNWQEDALIDLAASISSPGNILLATQERNGKPWHTLLFGPFETAKAARQGAKNLPHQIQTLKPWPRKIGGILSK